MVCSALEGQKGQFSPYIFSYSITKARHMLTCASTSLRLLRNFSPWRRPLSKFFLQRLGTTMEKDHCGLGTAYQDRHARNCHCKLQVGSESVVLCHAFKQVWPSQILFHFLPCDLIMLYLVFFAVLHCFILAFYGFVTQRKMEYIYNMNTNMIRHHIQKFIAQFDINSYASIILMILACLLNGGKTQWPSGFF